MFEFFLLPLSNYFDSLNALKFITFRGILAAITSLLISYIAGPFVIRQLQKLKLGQSVRTDGPETHFVKQGTPTMGGLLMIISVVISTLFWQNFDSFYSWLFVVTILAFGTLGFLDDFLKIKYRNSEGISSTVKSSGQFIISTIVVLILVYRNTGFDFSSFNAETSILLFGKTFDLSYFYIPFAIFILVGTSNATNLTDGLDGLLTGLLLFAFATFGIIAYFKGHYEFANYLNIEFNIETAEMVIPIAAICGATLGFLWYNCYPAQVFMGDTGSLAFGGVLALTSIILKKELLLILIGGVFVIETLSVIIQVFYFKYTKKKYGEGKRIFLMSPLHHHFEKKGWSETKVVTRFWILGILFALIALGSIRNF